MEDQAENGEAGQGGEALFASRRAEIAARAGARGDFLRIPQLAAMLCVSAASIHAHMKRGTFPIPHRKVGKASVVKVDDYVRWFHADPPEPPEPTIPGVDPGVARAQAKARKQRFKQEVLDSLRRKGHAI